MGRLCLQVSYYASFETKLNSNPNFYWEIVENFHDVDAAEATLLNCKYWIFDRLLNDKKLYRPKKYEIFRNNTDIRVASYLPLFYYSFKNSLRSEIFPILTNDFLF